MVQLHCHWHVPEQADVVVVVVVVLDVVAMQATETDVPRLLHCARMQLGGGAGQVHPAVQLLEFRKNGPHGPSWPPPVFWAVYRQVPAPHAACVVVVQVVVLVVVVAVVVVV